MYKFPGPNSIIIYYNKGWNYVLKKIQLWYFKNKMYVNFFKCLSIKSSKIFLTYEVEHNISGDMKILKDQQNCKTYAFLVFFVNWQQNNNNQNMVDWHKSWYMINEI